MRILAAVFVALTLLPMQAFAQDDQTLADIRQELTVLYVEIQRLKRELSTTGSASVTVGGDTVLDRMTSIENEMQRLTAKTEQLEFRVNRIVEDGTNRIGDLEFRLVELEGGDISTLGETTSLGGDAGDPPLPTAPLPDSSGGGAELAVGEQADFDRAKEAYDAGSYETAAQQFQSFSETYTGGPLTAESHFWRGKSLAALGDVSGAARAYLGGFSGDPQSMVAPQSLLELGLSIDMVGQKDEACVMLGEVTVRYPTSAASVEAQAARSELGCA